MSLPSYTNDTTLGSTKCVSDRQSWACPNMKEKEGDNDMDYERYKCNKCGRVVTLSYSEMS